MKDMITITEAAQRADVSIATLRRILKDYNITTYKNPRDARVRLVKASDIDAVLAPVPEQPTQQRPNTD